MVLAYMENKIGGYAFLRLRKAGIRHKAPAEGEVVVVQSVTFKAVQDFLFIVVHLFFRLRSRGLRQQKAGQEENEYD